MIPDILKEPGHRPHHGIGQGADGGVVQIDELPLDRKILANALKIHGRLFR